MRSYETAAHLAIIISIEGYTAILKTMNVLGINVRTEAEVLLLAATRLDGQRICRTEQSVCDASKRTGIQLMEEQVANREHFRDQEGGLFGPGIAD